MSVNALQEKNERNAHKFFHKVKEFLKRFETLRTLYYKFIWYFSCLLTIISPTLNTKYLYWLHFGKKINLKHPTTFNEKLLWLKLYRYMNDPVVIQCADKYCVRNFVKARGYGHLLNDLIGVYDDPRDIPWNELPSRFVLKWNFGSGMNIICSHKENNFEEIARKLKKWKRCKYWLPYSEMQYKYCEKKIICEKYLSDDESEGSSLSDYKVYCFSGKPLCVMVMHDRFSGINIEFFDANWNPLENPNMVESTEKPTQRPACLQELLSASAKLSEGFPFVRCDFYIVGGKLYFGEMTFTPAGGLSTYETTINGKSMTEYLEIDA